MLWAIYVRITREKEIKEKGMWSMELTFVSADESEPGVCCFPGCEQVWTEITSGTYKHSTSWFFLITGISAFLSFTGLTGGGWGEKT